MLSSVEQAFVGREEIRAPLKTPAWEATSSPEGVLRISSDRDDQMGAKIKTQKNPLGFKQNPKKSLDQNLSPQK